MILKPLTDLIQHISFTVQHRTAKTPKFRIVIIMEDSNDGLHLVSALKDELNRHSFNSFPGPRLENLTILGHRVDII